MSEVKQIIIQHGIGLWTIAVCNFQRITKLFAKLLLFWCNRLQNCYCLDAMASCYLKGFPNPVRFYFQGVFFSSSCSVELNIVLGRLRHPLTITVPGLALVTVPHFFLYQSFEQLLQPLVLPYFHPGPQREIFSRGVKIDAGPPKLSDALTDKSKKVFTQIWPYFLPKIRWRAKNKKGIHSKLVP